MRRIVAVCRHYGKTVKVKATEGIRTLADALAIIQAGAERIGTGADVKIIEELRQLDRC